MKIIKIEFGKKYTFEDNRVYLYRFLEFEKINEEIIRLVEFEDGNFNIIENVIDGGEKFIKLLINSQMVEKIKF